MSNGTLALNIKEGKFSKNYQGLVEIKGKSIKEAIDTYFNSSEQVKSFFKLFNIFNLKKYEPSSNHIAGAIKLGKKLGPGKTIVTILCDLADRYKSKIFNKKLLKEKNIPIPKWL